MWTVLAIIGKSYLEISMITIDFSGSGPIDKKMTAVVEVQVARGEQVAALARSRPSLV
jgi:hypothetical protein